MAAARDSKRVGMPAGVRAGSLGAMPVGLRDSNRVAMLAGVRVGSLLFLAVALLIAIATAARAGEDRKAVPEGEGVAVCGDRQAQPNRGSTADRDDHAAATRETGVAAAASVEADAEVETTSVDTVAKTEDATTTSAPGAIAGAGAEARAASADTGAITEDATTPEAVATMEDEPGSAGSAGPATVFTDEGRAVAVGYLLDTPRSPEVTDRALAVSEKLRQRYGIDTGHPVIDREDAARRAQAELLDRLEFEERELREMAGKLGYSLDPAKCANYCENVRELAEVELKRLALERFADGKPFPGRLRDESVERGNGEDAEIEPEIFSESTTEEDPEN